MSLYSCLGLWFSASYPSPSRTPCLSLQVASWQNRCWTPWCLLPSPSFIHSSQHAHLGNGTCHRTVTMTTPLLLTSTVVLTWWLYSVASLEQQTTGTITCYPNQSLYPDTEWTSPYRIRIMPSAWLGNDKFKYFNHRFNSTGNQAPNFPDMKPTFYNSATARRAKRGDKELHGPLTVTLPNCVHFI